MKVVVNGNAIAPEVPAQIIDGSTLLPLRSVAESLGASVEWDQNTYSAIINSNNTSANNKTDTIVSVVKKIKEMGAELPSYYIDEFGPFILFSIEKSADGLSDVEKIANIAKEAGSLDIDSVGVYVTINDVNSEVITIHKEDIDKYRNNSIDFKRFVVAWEIKPASN